MGQAEAFMRLRQTLGNYFMANPVEDYKKERIIAACNFERTGHQSYHTGISARNGQMLTLTCENSGLGAAGDYAVVLLSYGACAKLTINGVELLESYLHSRQ